MWGQSPTVRAKLMCHYHNFNTTNAYVKIIDTNLILYHSDTEVYMMLLMYYVLAITDDRCMSAVSYFEIKRMLQARFDIITIF